MPETIQHPYGQAIPLDEALNASVDLKFSAHELEVVIAAVGLSQDQLQSLNTIVNLIDTLKYEIIGEADGR